MYTVFIGNISRSPEAEVVFKNLVNKGGFDSKFLFDSAP
jgi:protein-tyrosine-phosphatase